MTVSIKQNVVKTLVKEAIESLGLELPVNFAKSVQIELDENGMGGVASIKFKANKNFGNEAPATTPSTSNEVNGLEFARGEKRKMQTAFKDATANLEGFKASKVFGQIVELRNNPAMVIAFEDNKIVCRRENGKLVKTSVKNVCDQLFGEAETVKPSTPSSSSSSSSDSSDSDKNGLEFARGEKRNMQKEFNAGVANLVENGSVDKASAKKVKALFGTTVEIRNNPALVIGLDGNKVVARRANGKTCTSRLKTIFENMSSQVEDDNSDNETQELKVVKKSETKKEKKLSSKDKTKAAIKFERNAAKLERDGVNPDWFYKCVKLTGHYFRMIEIDVKAKTISGVNIETGKSRTVKIKELLSF